MVKSLLYIAAWLFLAYDSMADERFTPLYLSLVFERDDYIFDNQIAFDYRDIPNLEQSPYYFLKCQYLSSSRPLYDYFMEYDQSKGFKHYELGTSDSQNNHAFDEDYSPFEFPIAVGDGPGASTCTLAFFEESQKNFSPAQKLVFFLLEKQSGVLVYQAYQIENFSCELILVEPKGGSTRPVEINEKLAS